MSVKSVYNFVPAPTEEQVFKPDWADKVSHDIPFSDGESGEIELTITAKTPIFIRNGHTKADKELFDKQKKGELPNPTEDEKKAIERYLEFSYIVRNGKKEYFIPATSIKGMIRNVLEIMSLSRLSSDNDIFGFRNLNHTKYKKEVAINKEIKTGWLIKENGNWLIKECKFGRIEYIRWNKQEKTSIEKYKSYLGDNRKLSIESFEYEKDLGFGRGSLYQKNNTGSFKGYLVFYGSIQNKKYEYIFAEHNDNKTFNVSADLIQRFESIDRKQENTLWQYFKSNNPYSNNRVPVFFKANDAGDVEHFGFSRLYKMSNTYELNELNPLSSYYNRKGKYQFDLVDTIFGTVEDTDKSHGTNRNKESLKGRVFIGHGFAFESVNEMEEVEMILADPKASYFPFYLRNGKTYLDSDAELKGFKKYPVRDDLYQGSQNEDNEEIKTKLKPLNSGVKFRTKIRFHNLRKIEIGALLSAITFHGNNKLLDHNLGSAKPLGYGRINIIITNLEQNKIDEYLYEFENTMNNHSKKVYNKEWLKLDALKELYAMAIDPVKKELLRYPEIELQGVSPRDSNEFANYVKNNEYLLPYSQFYKEGDLNFVSVDKRHEIEKRKQKEQQELITKLENEYQDLLSEGDKEFANKNYDRAINLFSQATNIDIKDTSEAEKRLSESIKELDRINKEYEQIIKEADNFFNKKEYENALEKYMYAIGLKPNEEYPRQQKNKCNDKLSASVFSLDGLKDDNDFNRGKKIIEKYFKKVTDHTIIEDENQISTLKGFIQRCIQKSNKRWKKPGDKDWKLVEKWVGKEIAQQWYNEIKKK